MNERGNPDCLFCKIVGGDMDADKLFEDERVLAFRDIHPQAPFHALIVPKKHLATLNDFEPDDLELAGHLMLTAKHLAAQHALAGYRVAMNVGREGGQVIFHVHLHMLGGRPLAAALG